MESVAQGNLSSLLCLGALMVVIAFLLFRSQRYFARQERPWMPPAEPASSSAQRPAHHLGAPDGLVQWEVEMHDVARDLSGQLTSKMSALEHLIREADRAAARLEATLEAMRRVAVTSPGPVAAEEAEQSAPRREPPRPINQADALQPGGSAEAAAALSPRAAASSARPAADRRYEEIYLLADYGFEPGEIANRVRMPIGEIQLILSLRRKR